MAMPLSPTLSLKDILIPVHQAWADLLNEQLLYQGNILQPNLDCWSCFPDEPNLEWRCMVCVAGAYYFAQTGKPLHTHDVGPIEIFIDTLRGGRERMLYLLASLPNPRYDQLKPCILQTLAIWPEDPAFDNLFPQTYSTNAKILELLSLLISNLQHTNL
jgi:hypothetical protein